MNTNTCDGCVYSKANPDDFGRTKWCFRFPPTVSPVGGPRGIVGVSMRPQVAASTEACGEFVSLNQRPVLVA